MATRPDNISVSNKIEKMITIELNESQELLNKLFVDACKAKTLKEVLALIDRGAKNQNKGFLAACREGNTNIVQFLVERYRNYLCVDDGMIEACKGGHKDVVVYLIKLGACNINYGMYHACYGGHKELVLYMIEIGAINWNSGLHGACERGHKDIAILMIERGAWNIEIGLYYACYGGHIELVLLMIEKGARDWDYGLNGAHNGGHKELVLFMIEKGANINKEDLLDDDILYLMKRGVNSFGKYTKVCNYWKQWEIESRLNLSDLMIPDLVNIIVS